MNFNDYPERLRYEEQNVLDQLISKMNRVIDRLDKKMKQYIKEAKNADIAVNPDMYFARVLAEQGKKDTETNRMAFLKARDELYHTRLLLKCDDDKSSDVFEIKVGLHSCANEGERFVVKWTMPLCQHYLLDSAAVEYKVVDTDRFGRKNNTYNYTLLAKNKITLRFTHVKDVVNLFPVAFDDKTMKMLKGKGFFSDDFLNEMLDRFNPDEFDPNSAEKIISDEFLKELLERRLSSEFKNIVFSIQKKQGEIIQAPYQRNMVVQGCAGSGKSMIMLHRLPILLYNHADSLTKTSLYVITPSQMYIQLAENMRYDLEISDIDMGTIEDYYDHCISKYPGHKAGEYGRINWGHKLSLENEAYIYSTKCVEDIKKYFNDICQNEAVSLEQAYKTLNIKPEDSKISNDAHVAINSRLSSVHGVILVNRRVIQKYYICVRDILIAFQTISNILKNRKSDILREITKQISQRENEISTLEKELKKLDRDRHVVAIQNRKDIIELRINDIKELELKREKVEADNNHFEYLLELNKKIEDIIAPFPSLKNEMYKNTDKDIYEAIDNAGKLIGGYYMLAWDMSKAEDEYITNIDDISKSVQKAGECVAKLQATTDKYLNYDYYSKIRDEYDSLEHKNTNAVMNAYNMIMAKIGLKRTDSGTLRAIKCSPYIYLQVLYQYQGAPASGREFLLAIDEAQGIAPEEIRLLKNVNNEKVVFNMFGDIYQHIEGTKGIDSWSEFNDIVDFDEYEMLENYRNASQITDYCNNKFGMKMIAINTPGKGVHEIKSDSEFEQEMLTQLLGAQRAGLAAILVNNTEEARYLLDRFSSYVEKFNVMTGENFNIHQTRWNLINIDDAKGLEFSTVIAISGRMTRNQKYIAYTRALDDLYVYDDILDISELEKKARNIPELSNSEIDVTAPISIELTKDYGENNTKKQELNSKHVFVKVPKNHAGSEVKRFFEERGFEVCDKRDEGGRLWVIGEKKAIRNVVNEAISEFKISGKYLANKEIQNRNGWCTKTDK